MTLKTHESWEQKDDFMNAIRGEEGTRRYPFFEVALNIYLFHVDVLAKDEDPDQQRWSRFVFSDIHDVLLLAGKEDVEEISVSLQSRRCDNDDDEYAISTVSEIIEAKDHAGQPAQIYICKNGRRYVSSHLAEDETELTDKKTIYYQSGSPR